MRNLFINEFYKGITKTSRYTIYLAFFIIVFSIITDFTIQSEFIISEQLKTVTVTNSIHKAYLNYMPYFWFGSMLLLILGTVKSFIKSFHDTQKLLTQLGLSSFTALSFLIISLIYLGRIPNAQTGHYTLVMGIFSVMAVCIGWLINTQITRKYEDSKSQSNQRNYKRTHTINILVKINLSQDFQSHIEQISSVYGGLNTQIPDTDAELFINNKEMDPEKKKAIRSILFILDLYEFICEGIEQGDIDEEVMYQSFFGAMYRSVTKARHLIEGYQLAKFGGTPYPKSFLRLTNYINKHKDRYEDENAFLNREIAKKTATV